MFRNLHTSYTETVNGHSFQMIYIKGGSFWMGDDNRENPIHEVSLTDYWLGQYPVTQGLWKAVMGENPAHFRGDALPVEHVSWEDVQTFIKELNELTDNKYGLPTEAQWEYAARGGFYNDDHSLEYSGSDDSEEVVWHRGNNELTTMPPGLKAPNALGLYDMSGNAWEWCLDAYKNDFYQSEKAQEINPLNDNYEPGSYRVLRGGSWRDDIFVCSVSSRGLNAPDDNHISYGFRLSRVF